MCNSFVVSIFSNTVVLFIVTLFYLTSPYMVTLIYTYHNIIIYPNKSRAHINAWAPKTRGLIQPSKVDYIKCRKG